MAKKRHLIKKIKRAEKKEKETLASKTIIIPKVVEKPVEKVKIKLPVIQPEPQIKILETAEPVVIESPAEKKVNTYHCTCGKLAEETRPSEFRCNCGKGYTIM